MPSLRCRLFTFPSAKPLLMFLALLWGAFPAAAGDSNTSAECQSDAMIVFDASGSMGTTDRSLKVPHIARVKQSMARVIPEVAPLRRLGLIVYGEGEYNDCNAIELRLRPTAGAARTLLHAVEDINPRGRTPLTQSVRLAAETLNYKAQEATVVLLTDGEETCGGDPCKLAAELKTTARNLTIHVIGYRTETSGYFTTRCMADMTGGQYLSVSTEEELVNALRKTLGCPNVSYLAPEPTAGMRQRYACSTK
ncbi:MAG: VWA domain-containing protein [Hyphomicrobium sp.]